MWICVCVCLQGETKVLKLKNLRPQDFANYTCQVSVRNVCDIPDSSVTFRLTNSTSEFPSVLKHTHTRICNWVLRSWFCEILLSFYFAHFVTGIKCIFVVRETVGGTVFSSQTLLLSLVVCWPVYLSLITSSIFPLFIPSLCVLSFTVCQRCGDVQLVSRVSLIMLVSALVCVSGLSLVLKAGVHYHCSVLYQQLTGCCCCC